MSIYTDGACIGNPGPGGYGVILDYKGRRRELSGGYRRTTNNRMELLAVIEALAALKEPCNVEVCSDSQYVVKAMNSGWPQKWRRNGWRRSKTQPAANPDLWAKLLDLCETHRVKFQWVRGHSGHPENERCDELATTAAHSSRLLPDVGYENVLHDFAEEKELVDHVCDELRVARTPDPLGKMTSKRPPPGPQDKTPVEGPQRHWIPAKSERERPVDRPANPYDAPRRGSVRAKRKRTKRGRLS